MLVIIYLHVYVTKLEISRISSCDTEFENSNV